MHYYYNIDGNLYKYTCDNKNSKYVLRFYCTVSKCKSKGISKIETYEFTCLNDKIYKLIEYERHSYVIQEKFKLKYDNNEFTKKIFG